MYACIVPAKTRLPGSHSSELGGSLSSKLILTTLRKLLNWCLARPGTKMDYGTGGFGNRRRPETMENNRPWTISSSLPYHHPSPPPFPHSPASPSLTPSYPPTPAPAPHPHFPHPIIAPPHRLTPSTRTLTSQLQSPSSPRLHAFT
ncbi:hypothetical protein O988_07223 [Pseudogymnoascus sp. VKM F-3808]|nr:hypothetical protein O988_07223 [Pseudogymnoascus sp. VKM F-3808]